MDDIPERNKQRVAIFGLWSQKEFANHAMPLVAFTEYANAREFRKNVYRTLVASGE